MLARGADTNKLRDKLLHVGEGVLACHQIKGLPWTPMSAKNTSVALSAAHEVVFHVLSSCTMTSISRSCVA